jgi:hypothetical protein
MKYMKSCRPPYQYTQLCVNFVLTRSIGDKFDLETSVIENRSLFSGESEELDFKIFFIYKFYDDLSNIRAEIRQFLVPLLKYFNIFS